MSFQNYLSVTSFQTFYPNISSQYTIRTKESDTLWLTIGSVLTIHERRGRTQGQWSPVQDRYYNSDIHLYIYETKPHTQRISWVGTILTRNNSNNEGKIGVLGTQIIGSGLWVENFIATNYGSNNSLELG